MNKSKILSGLISVLIGSTLSMLIMDLMSKPENVPVSLDPIDTISGYFFTFVFTMGTIGWFAGGLLLIAVLSAFYFLGTWIYKLISKNK